MRQKSVVSLKIRGQHEVGKDGTAVLEEHSIVSQRTGDFQCGGCTMTTPSNKPLVPSDTRALIAVDLGAESCRLRGYAFHAYFFAQQQASAAAVGERSA
jgi:heterodisulfide reductase subunit C